MAQNNGICTPGMLREYYDEMISMSGSRKEADSRSRFELFCMQGRLIAGLTDDFRENLHNYFTPQSYSDMSFHDFRVYITWRTSVRNGRSGTCSRFLVSLYINELMNNIGTLSSEDGFSRIALLWKGFRQYGVVSENLFYEWLKMYYIQNKFDRTFRELAEDNGLSFRSFGSLFDENDLSCYYALAQTSSYKPAESKFIQSSGLLGFASVCFASVLVNLRPLFERYSVDIKSFISGGTLFCRWERSSLVKYTENADCADAAVSDSEVYLCRNGEWWQKLPSPKNSLIFLFVGYIFRRTESQLRQLTGAKYRLNPAKELLLKKIPSDKSSAGLRLFIEDRYFDLIIDDTVKTLYLADDKTAGRDNILEFRTELSMKLQKIQKRPLYRAFSEMCLLSYLYHTEEEKDLLYFKQASALSGVRDNFSRYREHETANPELSRMQLPAVRSYVTFRTKTADGDFSEASSGYIYLLCYEIINRISFGKEEGFGMLSKLLRHYAYKGRSFEKKLSAWIRDFYLLNSFEVSFEELASRHGIEKYYPSVFISGRENPELLNVYSWFSGYGIEENSFYNDKTAPVLKRCFLSAVKAAGEFFEKNGIDYEEFLFGTQTSAEVWKPFSGARYLHELPESLCIPFGRFETYIIKDKAEYVQMTSDRGRSGAMFSAYLLRRTEAKVRSVMNSRQKLSSDIGDILKKMPEGIIYNKVRKAVNRSDFSGMIDKAVSECLSEEFSYTFAADEEIPEFYPQVSIDAEKLKVIRSESDVILNKLIISEPEDDDADTASAAMEAKSSQDEGFGALFENLTDTQISALRIIAEGKNTAQKLYSLASSCGMMSEVLIEGINNCASDYTGDIILDTSSLSVCFYEDYIKNIKYYLDNKR